MSAGCPETGSVHRPHRCGTEGGGWVGSQGLRLLVSFTVVEFKGATAAGEGAGIAGANEAKGPGAWACHCPSLVLCGHRREGRGQSRVSPLLLLPSSLGLRIQPQPMEARIVGTSLLILGWGRVRGGCRRYGFAGTVCSATPADPVIGPLSDAHLPVSLCAPIHPPSSVQMCVSLRRPGVWVGAPFFELWASHLV